MAFAAALALHRGAAPRVQSFAVQEPAVLRRRRGAHRDRRARHGASRRPHPSHAADRVRLPGRLRRDLGAAAAQRLRLRMADLPGDPAEPATAVMGAQAPGAGGRRAARAVGGARRGLLRQGVRRDVSRPPAHAAPPKPRRRPTGSRSRRCIFLAALCLLAGILPGLFIDALAPVTSALVGGRMPVQTGAQWLSIVPIAASRSSYDGLLVFLFMVISGTLAAFAIHRLASDRLRRAPAWDCGYPDPSPATQYTASSFAQPIRRVFGTVVFRAREHGEMPPPGDMRPARLDGRAARSRSGTRSTRRSPPASASPPIASIICSS